MTLNQQINQLIDLHESVYDAEIRLGLVDHRSDYMRYLIEETLIELGHSLKGMMHLSKRSKIDG